MESIEFAHIYLDEILSPEQKRGKEEVLKLIRSKSVDSYDLVTLIDDYNALDRVLDLFEYENYLNAELPKKIKLLYESDMIFYSSQTLDFLKKEDSKSYKRYIHKYGKFPCSLLAITFYLIRLGVIKSKLDIVPSDKITNVLSRRFKEVEDISIKLLARSKVAGIEKRIETIYIESSNELYRPKVITA